MSDFTAYFPATARAESSSTPLTRLGAEIEERLGQPAAATHVADGTSVLITGQRDSTTRLYHSARGWVVVAGLMIDASSKGPQVDLEDLLGRFSGESAPDVGRYEGAFALAAWDSRSRTAWVLNDQPSCLNCYYGEFGNGLFATTSAVPLARWLGLQLDPRGIWELFARGTLLTPRSMFSGLRRVDLGEHVRYRAGRLQVGKHWSPYQPQESSRAAGTDAAEIGSLAADRVARLMDGRNSVVADLTGGLDSRLVVAVAHHAGRLSAVTTDGPDDSQDVRIAKDVAGVMGWPVEHFEPGSLWDQPITPEMRRQLLVRTNGELPFTEVYHHSLARPILARRYELHFNGGGGELLRSFPWSQEFFGIGRRRPANVDNALRYRFFQEGPPPHNLFATRWYPALFESFRRKIAGICRLGPGSLTTQQLDAVYLWRMTGFAQYASANFGWLPTVAPLMCAGLVDRAIALPWKRRLTSGLMKRIIFDMAPRAAEVRTCYGGTAAPARLATAHREILQISGQAAHLVRKLASVYKRRSAKDFRAAQVPVNRPTKPYLTEEFRSFMNPREMLSRRLYEPEGLRTVLAGSAAAWRASEALILRMATIEELCRELDAEPDADFLDPAAAGGIKRDCSGFKESRGSAVAANHFVALHWLLSFVSLL